MMHSVQVSYLCYTVWIRQDKAQQRGLKNRQAVDDAMFLELVERDNCCFSDNNKISAVPQGLH